MIDWLGERLVHHSKTVNIAEDVFGIMPAVYLCVYFTKCYWSWHGSVKKGFKCGC